MEKTQISREELDDFLKSIGGLVNGFFTDREPITDSYFFEVDCGWYPLIKDLIQDLIDLGWNKEICQIKEKFGGLRFYINSGSPEIHARISKAESDSYKICEVCGNPGEVRGKSWLQTLCDEHNQKLNK